MGVELQFGHRRATVAPGDTLFEIAESLHLHVPTSCHKQGRCKECLVEVVEGREVLSERTAAESHLRDPFRLSCQARIQGGSGIIRCHTLRRGEMRIERHAFGLPIDRSALMIDPCVRRDGDRILLDGLEIDRRQGPMYGLATDLGTTTVVVRLLDLESGEVVADSAFENPQRFGGSDVMSRIHFDTHHPGKLLQRTLAGYVTHAIEEFPVDPMSIYEMVVVGNSTMRDVFFRLDVHSIGQYPYQSISEAELYEGKRSTTSLVDTPRRLRLPIHPKARIYGLPLVGSHIGADAAACMLAVNLAGEDRLVAIMDIGTNTELIVGNRQRIVAASCPAGPAFEGGRISCGMPALPGAIEKVALQRNGSFACQVIGNLPAEGICGSGLVDLLAELVRAKRINSLGRFINGDRGVTVLENEEQNITLTEGDINELAQAKGANVAGLHIVFKTYGIRFEDLDAFYLAGGFGRYVNLESAQRIGLIPEMDSSKIVQVGNAAIEGACLALLSRQKRSQLEELVSRVEHCRLEADPAFFDSFVDGCQFNRVVSEETDRNQS